MRDFSRSNYFKDMDLLEDPYSYYEYLRQQGNVVPMPQHGVVAVLGYEEALSVWRDDDNFSAINAVIGPLAGVTFPSDKDDISEDIETFRTQIQFGGLVATQDPPEHAKTRSLMAGVLTPKRLRDNEAFMWRLTDDEIDKFIDKGKFEVVSDFAVPLANQAIAELLGVPEEDFVTIGNMTEGGVGVPGHYEGTENAANNPLAGVAMYFFEKLSERRAQPREDLLTVLANATYQDGTLPEVAEVVGIAAFLFGAGQDTTASLVTAALRVLADDLELQSKLRADPALIPNFLEEMLRTEGTVKALFRLAKRPVTVGGVDIRPGTHVMLVPAAANRDPRRFENPQAFIHDRKNARDNLSFGRGIHACIGSPLARAEAKAALERLLARTAEFRVNEEMHGPPGARRHEFAPSYMFRVRSALHLEFSPKL